MFLYILYVFGLNSMVCSHIVGVYLSSDQVTYYFMIFLKDLHKTFWGTAKKWEKKINLIFISKHLSEMHEILNEML